VSDDVLSIVPADPAWRPDPAAADRTAALAAELAPSQPGLASETKQTWHEGVAFVDCGQNLETIACPQCREPLELDWWQDRMSAGYDDAAGGFVNLAVDLPCCGRRSSLAGLEYDWPCAFASFEIEIWNPERVWFTAAELDRLGAALGHPVRQVRAHI
jgi:uncharacterized protein YbaR (Trm112 family)